MSKTVVYIYAMTNDTGFAPCIHKNLLTLACCKGGKNGGMRKSAAYEFLAGSDVYILGLCGGGLAQTHKMKYRPIYLAKIDAAVKMTDYYATGMSKGRLDDVYEVVDGELKHKGSKLPHSDSRYIQAKDIGGKYVLCSHQFTYWGNKCGESGCEIEEAFKYIFENRTDGKKGIRDRRGFRGYIVENDLTGFADALSNWDWFPKEAKSCNIISTRTINGDSVGGCGGKVK